MIEFELLRNISAFSIIIPIIIGLFTFRNLQINEKIFYVFLYAILLSESLLYYTCSLSIDNHYIIRAFSFVEYAFVSAFFILSVRKSVSFMKIVLIALLLVGVLAVSVAIYINDSNLNSVFTSIEAFTFIVLALLIILKSQFSTSDSLQLTRCTNILNLSILFNYSTTFIVLLFGNWILLNNPILFRQVWLVFSFASLITNILFSVALWKVQPQTK